MLPERLELEKKRSRQSLEDAEQLRFKEVPISCVIWALPSLFPQWGMVSLRQTPGWASLNNLGLLLTVPADVRPKPSLPVSRRDPDCARATVQAAIWGAALGPALRPSFLRSHLGQPLVGKNRVPKIHLPPPGWGSHEGKPRGPDCQPYPCLAPGQVEHMTRHLEDSERAMQERVQRLEAARLSLEEVSWVPGLGG